MLLTPIIKLSLVTSYCWSQRNHKADVVNAINSDQRHISAASTSYWQHLKVYPAYILPTFQKITSQKSRKIPTLTIMTICCLFHEFLNNWSSQIIYLLVGVTGGCIVKRLIDGVCNARLLKRPDLHGMIHATWYYVRSCDVDILTMNTTDPISEVSAHGRKQYLDYSGSSPKQYTGE